MDNFQQRTLALAGVFNIAALVHQLSNTGNLPSEALESAIKSIFITDPSTSLDVFGDLPTLEKGFTTLINHFTGKTITADIDIARYVVSMLYLERRLAKNTPMLTEIGKGVDLAIRQAEHFSAAHENVIANLADLYTRTISELGSRIMVSGEERYLRVPENANKIRALLMSGIRAAVLWHQLGGRRWHLLFHRARYVKTAKYFLSEIS